MSKAIELRNVAKSYKRGSQSVEVLRELSLDIDAGEFIAMMGPSGSGKTTLLNLVSGLDRPTSGEITVNGNRIDRMTGSELARWRSRHVGLVFQFYNLVSVLSAERNVEVPLLLTSLSKAQRQRNVAAALGLVGLTDRAKHKPAELSGGQQQRVAIARALVSDPSFFVCDEPTGDLDRGSAEEIMKLLQRLNVDQRKTIIMVTHDPLAAAWASRQVHLDKGSLTESRYLHRSVEQLEPTSAA